MDLNSLTSQYLQKNKDAKFDDIKSAVDNLTISYIESFDREARDGSIFSKYEDSDGLTQDEFISLMCEATGKSKSEIEKDAILLYQVLNSDDDLSSLTNEELAVLMDEGEITSYTVWSGLALDEETVTEKIKGSSDDKKVEDDPAGEDDPTVENNPAIEDDPAGEDENKEPDIKPYTGDFSDPEDAIAYVESLYNPDEGLTSPKKIIEYLKNEKLLPPDDIAELEEAFKRYDNKTEELIEKRMTAQTGKTRAEIIEQLKNEGIITDETPTTICDEEIEIETIDYKAYAEDIWYAMKGKGGTNEDMIESILLDPTISDEDFAKIVAEFQKAHPEKGLVTYFMNETSGKRQDSWCAALATRLVQAANAGDETAIEVLTREMYSGGAERNGTADEFYDAFFATINDETLVKINDSYEDKYKGRSFFQDIDDEYGCFSSKDEKYVAQIKKALRNR